MMSSVWTLRLNRRRAFSNDSPSCSRTSATLITPKPALIGYIKSLPHSLLRCGEPCEKTDYEFGFVDPSVEETLRAPTHSGRAPHSIPRVQVRLSRVRRKRSPRASSVSHAKNDPEKLHRPLNVVQAVNFVTSSSPSIDQNWCMRQPIAYS